MRATSALAALIALAVATPAATAADLTMWKAGNCEPATCAEIALVEAFEAANPDISIEIVTQPVDSYFTSLLTSSAIGQGPDLATMWAGNYFLQFKPYLVDVRDAIPADHLAETAGLEYYAEDGNADKAIFGVPASLQWYNGFYNKALFEQAGIDQVPETWEELEAAAKKLADAGILPIVNGATDGSAQFQPLFEFAYLFAELPLTEWAKLYTGDRPYNTPEMVEQFERWNALFENGYMNEDAFNNPNALEDFKQGKAAMLLAGGSWLVNELEQALGDELGIIVPPYSVDPQRSVIVFPGAGWVAMNYSDNVDESAKFLAFVLSDEGQAINARFDAPVRPGFATDLKGINELAAISADGAWSLYPMFDNFSQAPVTDTIYRQSALVMVGQETAEAALAAMDASFESLPEEERQTSFPLSAN